MSEFLFEPFRLDPDNARLWSHDQPRALTPKAFAVLHYLVAHAGQLVAKDTLLEAVWPDTVVGEAVLKVCVTEIRKVLGESSKSPRFIATVHRRGYRFLAPVTIPAAAPATVPVSGDTGQMAELPATSWPRELSASQPPGHQQRLMVGRESAVEFLHAKLDQVRQGCRQVVFLTGEAGIGKTTLVEAFLAEIAEDPHLWIAQGQCVEHYGPGEAYLPVLEALGRLCRGPHGSRMVELLRRQAPTWLVQMPWLLSATDREFLQQELQGATRERMLRELVEALETLTADTPLVLVLEDLHWSDYATLDIVALLARRREEARLLLVGTYRPVDVIVRSHPLKALKQDLQMRHYCVELPLDFLSHASIKAYLAARFPGNTLPDVFVHGLHRRTDGNPLFLVNVVEDLLARRVIRACHGSWGLHEEPEAATAGVPEGLRQMIEQHIARLSETAQRVLEAASVDGMEFTAATVASSLAADVLVVEECCEELAQQQRLLQTLEMAPWPDGTVVSRYAFRHALYQQVVYQRIGPARRFALHRRIGEYLAHAYGPQADDMAALLAMHFLHGQEAPRAIHYFQRAADNALRRHAQREAIAALTQALQLIDTLPDTPERAQQELLLLITLGPALIATKGYAAPEVERVYTRARQLCEGLGDTPQLFPVLVGLRRFYQVRAILPTAYELGQRLLVMAQRQQDPAWLLEAHFGLGIALYYLADFARARQHCEQGIAQYDVTRHRLHAFTFGQDPGVVCHIYAALSAWMLGYPDQAAAQCQRSLALARQLGHPFSLAFALLHAAWLYALRREAAVVADLTAAALSVAHAQGFAYWIAWGTFLQGWAHARQAEPATGIASMHQGLEAARATGAAVGHLGFLGLLAATYHAAGQAERGLMVLDEALQAIDKYDECFYEAEIYRLTGELLLSGTEAQASQAERHFQHALRLARRQSARSLELRATLSLGRLWQRQGRQAEAHQILAPMYQWFSEGFATPDLQEARTLLATLA